jgi:hypothetical protein
MIYLKNRKKMVLTIMGIAAFAAAVVFNVSLGSRGEYLNDLALANVEALAEGEAVDVDCPGGPGDCAKINGPGGFTYKFYKQN